MRRYLLIAMAGLLLGSCAAHGQSSRIDPKVYRNYTPYSAAFYEALLTDRVWVFEGNPDRTNSVMRALVFGGNGRLFRCFRNWATPKSKRLRWSVEWRAGTTLRYENWGPKLRYAPFYYDPETGLANVEIFRADESGRLTWDRVARGWVQDTLPRAFAGACPGLAEAAGVKINEKQTSKKFDELRRQDPDAPIRHFPGSNLTAPGRTGIAASKLAPTTTREAVFAFMRAQHGNIVLSPKGNGRALVLGNGNRPHELWQLGEDGEIANTSEFHEAKDKDGEWLEGRRGGKRLGRYPMGYPFPYLPTGHRHAAFQLTDKLIGWPDPRSLPFMGEAYADRRFVFHAEGKFSVVDEAGNLVEGPHFEGGWRWTRGRLEMTVTDDPAGPRSIGWRELANQLGMKPTVWTRSTPDRY